MTFLYLSVRNLWSYKFKDGVLTSNMLGAIHRNTIHHVCLQGYDVQVENMLISHLTIDSVIMLRMFSRINHVYWVTSDQQHAAIIPFDISLTDAVSMSISCSTIVIFIYLIVLLRRGECDCCRPTCWFSIVLVVRLKYRVLSVQCSSLTIFSGTITYFMHVWIDVIVNVMLASELLNCSITVILT